MNQHENPEYQALATAIRELQRLYDMEMFVIDHFEATSLKHKETALDMVRSFLRPGAIRENDVEDNSQCQQDDTSTC